jgi:hypothetical protein
MTTPQSPPALPDVPDRGRRRAGLATWELTVRLRVADLVAQTKNLEPDKLAGPDGVAVEEALQEAWAIATSERGTLGTWWSGSRVERAWNAIHRAEAGLLKLDPHVARAMIPRLQSRIERAVTKSDKRREYANTLGDIATAPKPKFEARVPELAQLYRQVYAANDERQQALRSFRNRIVMTAIVLTGVLVVLALWHALSPEFLALCGTDEGAVANSEVRRCVDGGSSPHPRDVVLVLLLGTLGGLLSVGFTLGRASAGRNALFDPTPAQIALKAATGAATALIAVLLLQSSLFAITVESSEASVLAVAGIFGFAQHLLTRFVDVRADVLLGAAKTDDDAKTHDDAA